MDAFELLDPQSAQLFLKGFPIEARKRGEALFRNGRVQDLAPEPPGAAFFCFVMDEDRQEVHLYYTPDDGWGGDCSCIQEFDCPHVFAAMCALVAEGRTAAVRNLSAGLPPDTHALSGSSPRPGAAGPVNLEQRLIAATGRQL